MKTRSLFIGLMLALTLTFAMSTKVQASKPVEFNANGTIASISNPPDAAVIPAGNSSRWVVLERDIDGSISGDINGDFILTYKANVNALQAGILHGMLNVGEGSYAIEMNGKSQPIEIVWYEPFQTYLPRINMSGHWNFISGARGQGEFNAWFIFIPTPDGHIALIVDSDITLTGTWQLA